MGDKETLQRNDNAASSSVQSSALIPDRFFTSHTNQATEKRTVQTIMLCDAAQSHCKFARLMMASLNNAQCYVTEKVERPAEVQPRIMMEPLDPNDQPVTITGEMNIEETFKIQDSFFKNFQKDSVLNIIAVGHAGLLLASYLTDEKNNKIVDHLTINLIMSVDLGNSCSLQFMSNVNRNHKDQSTISIQLPYGLSNLLDPPLVQIKTTARQEDNITVSQVKRVYDTHATAAQNIALYAAQSFLSNHGQMILPNQQSLEQTLKNYDQLQKNNNSSAYINEHHISLMPNLLLQKMVTVDETAKAISQLSLDERRAFVQKYIIDTALRLAAQKVFDKLPQESQEFLLNHELHEYQKNKKTMPSVDISSNIAVFSGTVSTMIHLEQSLRNPRIWPISAYARRVAESEEEFFPEQKVILQSLFQRLLEIHKKIQAANPSDLKELLSEMAQLEIIVKEAAEATVYDPITNKTVPLITETDPVDISGLVDMIRYGYRELFIQQEYQDYLFSKKGMPTLAPTDSAQDLANKIKVMTQIEIDARKAENWKHSTDAKKITVGARFFSEQDSILTCLEEYLKPNANRSLDDMKILQGAIHQLMNAAAYDPRKGAESALLNKEDSQKIFDLFNSMFQAYVNTLSSTLASQPLLDKVANNAITISKNYKQIFDSFKQSMHQYHAILAQAKTLSQEASSKQFNQEVIQKLNEAISQLKATMRARLPDILEHLFTQFLDGIITHEQYKKELTLIQVEANKLYNGEIAEILPDIIAKVCKERLEKNNSDMDFITKSSAKNSSKIRDANVIVSRLQGNCDCVSQLKKVNPIYSSMTAQLNKFKAWISLTRASVVTEDILLNFNIVAQKNEFNLTAVFGAIFRETAEHGGVKSNTKTFVRAFAAKFGENFNVKYPELSLHISTLDISSDNQAQVTQTLNDEIKKYCTNYFLAHIIDCGTSLQIDHLITEINNNLNHSAIPHELNEQIMLAVNNLANPWRNYLDKIDAAYNKQLNAINADIKALMKEYDTKSNSVLHTGYGLKKRQIENAWGSTDKKEVISGLVKDKMQMQSGKIAPDNITQYELSDVDQTEFKTKLLDQNDGLKRALNASRHAIYDSTRTWFYTKTRIGRECHRFFHHTNEKYQLKTPTLERVEGFFNKPRNNKK
jgi:hypothetical protein